MAAGVLATAANMRNRVMTRASRIVCVVLVAAGALLPITASAIPIPSPTLASILLPPPSGYAELASAPFHGQFTSSAYAASWGKQSVEAEAALNEAGFVDAYATFWVDQLAKRALIEYVVAFEGGQGARSWLSFAETGSKADPTYQHANTMSGIDPYYGQHNVYPSHAILDEFAFVKGNDYFVVGYESLQDDVLNLAMTRAKNQYSAAPGSTIPTTQWPENANAASSQSPAFGFGGLVALPGIGEIAGQDDSIGAGILCLRRHRLDRNRVASNQRQARAFSRERLGDGAAHALGGAGNHRDASFEHQVHGPLAVIPAERSRAFARDFDHRTDLHVFVERLTGGADFVFGFAK